MWGTQQRGGNVCCLSNKCSLLTSSSLFILCHFPNWDGQDYVFSLRERGNYPGEGRSLVHQKRAVMPIPVLACLQKGRSTARKQTHRKGKNPQCDNWCWWEHLWFFAVRDQVAQHTYPLASLLGAFPSDLPMLVIYFVCYPDMWLSSLTFLWISPLFLSLALCSK